MEREIDYRHSCLKEVCKNSSQKADAPWDLFFSKVGAELQNDKENLSDPYQILERELVKISSLHPWEKDLAVIKNLGKGFGERDKKSQMIQFSIALEEIDVLLQEAIEEKKRKGKLYQTLGICMGILSVILVV